MKSIELEYFHRFVSFDFSIISTLLSNKKFNNPTSEKCKLGLIFDVNEMHAKLIKNAPKIGERIFANICLIS